MDHTRLLTIGIVLAVTVVFQALLGYYVDRLTWSLAPPVLAMSRDPRYGAIAPRDVEAPVPREVARRSRQWDTRRAIV